MSVGERQAELDLALARGGVRSQVRLAPMTTFKVGGAADWFFETSTPAEVGPVVAIARRYGLPVTLLGGGSNVLVGARGVRGLVVRQWHGSIRQPGPGLIRADAGVSLNGLVRWSARRGLSGLERWAGTPGTVGGAIHGNAHFDGCLIGDQVRAVTVLGPSGAAHELPAAAMEFGYDRSRLMRTGEVALWVDLVVGEGDPKELREIARSSLGYRKRTQPLSFRSAGCIFQNPDRRADGVPDDVPASAGALVDRAGLKGVSIGGATVSGVHGNFIVSDGTATPEDIRALIERCRDAVLDRFGVPLRNEIVYLGEF